MDIEPKLQSLTEQWRSIEDSNERERFYYAEVFPVVKEIVIPREQTRFTETFPHLIITVGLSPAPLILSIKILRPEKVYFIYTPGSGQFLDQIFSQAGLSISQVEKDEIEDTNIPDIYKKVNDMYIKWGQPDKIIVDISGGKKSMTGACALAAAMIGARLAYMDSHYVYDKPQPGSEHLVILDNPYDVFGDLKFHRVEALFIQQDFVGAQRLLQELQEATSTPQLYEARALLCEAYAAWDDWQIESAITKLEEAIQKIKKYSALDRHTPLLGQQPRLQEQLYVLKNLKQAQDKMMQSHSSELEMLQERSLYGPMLGTLRAGALRQEQRGKYDVAILMWYRLIEFLNQQRLSKYGLRTSEPAYEQTILDRDELQRKYKEILKKIGKGKGKPHLASEETLPKNIDLICGYTLLKAIGDPLTNTTDLGEMVGKVNARNDSIFAHGFTPTDQKKYENFKNLALKLLNHFINLEETITQDDLDICEFLPTL